eukprot:2997305-Alexandrium_andersonii.AAC.1
MPPASCRPSSGSDAQPHRMRALPRSGRRPDEKLFKHFFLRRMACYAMHRSVKLWGMGWDCLTSNRMDDLYELFFYACRLTVDQRRTILDRDPFYVAFRES